MISLNYRDARPIYEQIKDGLRRLMVTGALATEEKLPSVRSLASTLAINPNTIQRAYTELEAEGYITSVPGKGSFAAVPGQDAGRERREELLRRLDEIVEELCHLGLEEPAIAGRVEAAFAAAPGRRKAAGWETKQPPIPEAGK